jgi:hypothetical protein
MTDDDYELPDFSELSFDEIEAVLDKQYVRLHGSEEQDLTVSLIRLVPILPFAALFVLAFLIS